jgi:hypothetical protein
MQQHDSFKYEHNMTFEIGTTLNIRIMVLCDVTPLSLVDVHRSVGGKCVLPCNGETEGRAGGQASLSKLPQFLDTTSYDNTKYSGVLHQGTH